MSALLYPVHELRERIRGLRERMAEIGLDGYLAANPDSVRYLTGFTGDESWLFVPRSGRPVIVTDSRYVEEAMQSAPGASVLDFGRHKLKRGQAVTYLAARVTRRAPRLGVELNTLRAAEFKAICAAARKERRRVRVKGVADFAGPLRMRKSPTELRFIRKALDIQEQAFRKMQRWLKPGLTEREVAARLEYEMRMLGAQSAAFPIIVAEGPRGSLPHAQPGERKLGPNSAVLVDWGARYRHYNSDLTRVVFMGRIRPETRKVYAVVREAQEAAIREVRPGIRAQEVDAAARTVIAKAGYGRFFGHGTGHGVGLAIHEGPGVGPRSTDVLASGMVITIEPGIYLPGRLGVRIEDDVLVTDRGGRVLSRLSREISDMELA